MTLKSSRVNGAADEEQYFAVCFNVTSESFVYQKQISYQIYSSSASLNMNHLVSTDS